MDPIPETEVFDHDLGIDRQGWPDGLIGIGHKNMMKGGPFVYIIEMPIVEHKWSLTFRGVDVVASDGGAITVDAITPKAEGRRQVRSAKIIVMEDQKIVRVEVVLERMERGRELYLHNWVKMPGQTARVTTYPLPVATKDA